MLAAAMKVLPLGTAYSVWVGLDVGAVMASLGTSMGAAYLMLFVFHDLRAN